MRALKLKGRPPAKKAASESTQTPLGREAFVSECKADIIPLGNFVQLLDGGAT